ncbi:unnamed protein product [Polarella glacialis]|uniref:C3H1-type domain-containing protein n=1 Tax=Polarella glacialis TaxID=89957 RepID=A0A813J472_POLGL|nr:unnamed protein product [Polarella glacialis]
MATAPVASVKGLAEFEYPVPLFVHNTFIEAHAGRPASLDGFYHERQVFSCPGSRISEPPSSDCEPPLAGPRRSVYRPGQQLVQSAAFGGSAGQLFLSVPLGGGEGAGAGEERKELSAGSPAIGSRLGGAPPSPELDARSECSTADTLVSGSNGFGQVPTSYSQKEPSSRLSKWFHSFARVPSEASAPRLADVPVLCLDQALSASWPAEAAEECDVSLGAVGHSRGECKPCAFFHTKGCDSGKDCEFCHLCPKGEKQRRQKDKRAFFGSIRQFAAPLYAQQEDLAPKTLLENRSFLGFKTQHA